MQIIKTIIKTPELEKDPQRRHNFKRKRFQIHYKKKAMGAS
jgi:hypothetical protein